MFQIPGWNAHQTGIRDGSTTSDVQEPQLVRVLQNAFHGSVVQWNVTLGVYGDGQLLQVRETRWRGLILDGRGHQPDQAVGEAQNSQFWRSDLKLFDVDANRISRGCPNIGHVQNK